MRYTFIPPYFTSTDVVDAIEIFGFDDDLHSYSLTQPEKRIVTGFQDPDILKRDVVLDRATGKYLLHPDIANKEYMLFLRNGKKNRLN
jgi:hypothetical protein